MNGGFIVKQASMKKKKTERQSLPRGSMAQIMRAKEKADKWWGGELSRHYAVGYSCCDCLLLNCPHKCGGVT